MSLAAVVKWLLVIGSLPCFVKAWQGIVLRTTATGFGRADAASTRLLTGGEAVKYGLVSLLFAALLLGAAFCVWYFWQKYQD
jgi:hypothetical protein